MKPVSIIFSIILLLFSIVRFGNSCEKREKRQKTRDFQSCVNMLDNKKDSIMAYQYFEADSIPWMADHKKRFDISLDSSIEYYRRNYTQDEKRYKAYLNILFEYKKLSYLYSDWIKSSRIRANPAKMEKGYHLLTISEFETRERKIMFDRSRVNIDLMMID